MKYKLKETKMLNACIKNYLRTSTRSPTRKSPPTIKKKIEKNQPAGIYQF